MELKIGENIRRLRRERGITQEQLADVLNVSCAAISKWETGDSYPDITLIFPLSYYFKVSVDELLGYDAAVIENEIQALLTKYRQLKSASSHAEAKELIVEGRKKYPNDYRIMMFYVYELAGGLADNDPEELAAGADEINKICDTVLSGCNDEKLRLDAITYKAKVLHAGGNTKAAIKLLENFPSFYHASEQRIEQLYAKDTDDFYRQLTLNMYELADFAADKLAKSALYDKALSSSEKKEKILKIGKALAQYPVEEDFATFHLMALAFWGVARSKTAAAGYDDKFVIGCCEQEYSAAWRVGILAREHKLVKTYLNRKLMTEISADFFADYIKGVEKYLSPSVKDSPAYREIVKKHRE